MAERRMFARAITTSARFLRLSPAARLLYYDLGMGADDEGVVEAFTVLRTTAATHEALDELETCGLVVVLNEDDVTYIVDWTKNNQIRADRFHPSIYHDLIVAYRVDNQPSTDGCQLVDSMVTENRSGKDSFDEARLGKGKDEPPRFDSAEGRAPHDITVVETHFQERGYKSDPIAFCNYYAARGWRLKGTPVLDWEALAENWERREQELHPDKFAAAKWHADTRGFDVGYGEPVLDPETGETLPF